MIAHRLSTVQNADLIFVMKEGHVAESGNHKELMNRESIYRQLVTLQMFKTHDESILSGTPFTTLYIVFCSGQLQLSYFRVSNFERPSLQPPPQNVYLSFSILYDTLMQCLFSSIDPPWYYECNPTD